jgi:hypothetical protein
MNQESPWINKTKTGFKVMRDGLNKIATRLSFKDDDLLKEGESDNIRSDKIKKIIDAIDKAVDNQMNEKPLDKILDMLGINNYTNLIGSQKISLISDNVKKIIDTIKVRSNVDTRKINEDKLDVLKEIIRKIDNLIGNEEDTDIQNNINIGLFVVKSFFNDYDISIVKKQ